MNHRISLHDITTNINYEGYLWWSDKDEPEVFMNQKLKSGICELWPPETHNPFIIEGNLWDNENKTSYLIRFIDGQYFVFQFEMKGIEPGKITTIDYLPHRISSVKSLFFKEVWVEQPDPLCNGFEVLKPAFVAFVGFKYQ
jgi:CRISPR type III-associated protein (TIGR04423 family)